MSLADPEIRDHRLLGDEVQPIVDLRLDEMSTHISHVVVVDTGLMVEADHRRAPPPDHHPLGADGSQARPDHHHPHALDHRQLRDEILGLLGRGDRSHLVNHAPSLQVVQKHLAHLHLEDDVGALRQKAEAELHHAVGIDEDIPTQSPPGLDRGRATGEDITAVEATIAKDTRHILPMIEDTRGLTSSEVGQLTTTAV